MRDESEVVQENLSAEICANSVNMRNFVCDTTGTHYFNGALTSYLWTVFNEKIQERNLRHVMTLQHTTNKLTEKEVQEKISSLGEIIRMYDTYYIFGDLSIIRLDAVHKSNRTDIYAEIITEFLTDIEKNMDAIYEIFPSVNFTYCKIRWYLIRSDGSVMDVDFSEKLDDIILDEAYPYISYENSLDNYIYDYLNSDESILHLR